MDFITRFAVSKTRLTLLIMVGLVLQAVLLYFAFPKRDNPAITIRTAVVSAQFPGMAPKRIEALIATPLERKIREIGEVDQIDSLITTGSVTINVNFKESFASSLLPEVFQDLRNKMSEMNGKLPEGTNGPQVNTSFGDVAIATIAITGEGFNYSEIEEIGKDFQRYLYQVDGLAKIDLLGIQEERIWLEVDTRKLAVLGLNLTKVIQDLQAQNVILPAGEVDAQGTTILLEASGTLNSVKEIEEIVTKIDGLDGFVRLKELFKVRRGVAEPPEAPVFFNGQPAIVAAVQMLDANDIQELSVRLKKAVSQFESEQPIGISFSYATFQSNKVTESINGALANVAQTILVVLIVMLLFLGLKSAVIIAAIVPFAASFSLVFMGLIGIELEQISIAAVIISLGLLVDNGLVIVEDIQGQINKGVDPKEAAFSAGSQFMIPLLVASITTISAFIPMLVLEGTSGDYAFSLGAVVALMLIGSWLSSMYFLPLLCVWFIKPTKKAMKAEGTGRFTGLYETLVRRLLPIGFAIPIVMYLVVAGASTFFSAVPNQQFPEVSNPQFLIYMDMQKGTSITDTQKSAIQVSNWLSNREINPEAKNNILYVGSGGPRFDLGLNPADSNPSSAFFLVNTVDNDSALTMLERTRSHLLLNHPEARFKLKRLSMGPSESGIVDIEIKGPDADRLLTLGDEVNAIFANVPGIRQNENDWGNKVLKVIVDVRQEQARDLGISSEDISRSMAALFDGTQVSVYREGDKSIPIVVRAEEQFRSSVNDIINTTLEVGGRLISIQEVANLRSALEFSQLRRTDQVRTIKISGKSSIYTAGQLLDHIQPELDKLNLKGGYTLEVGGELKDASEVNEKLAAGGPLALMVMLAAIMFQFNSFRRTFLVFSTIPLVAIGVPFALLLTGKPLSFFGTLGFISLAGIIINNAIVLIDQIDIERKTKELKEAVISAAAKRLSPILLTTVTTVAGLIPMAITGGDLWSPMAVVMIGGLSLSSVFSLIFVPCFYYFLFNWGAARAKGKSEEVIAEEEEVATPA